MKRTLIIIVLSVLTVSGIYYLTQKRNDVDFAVNIDSTELNLSNQNLKEVPQDIFTKKSLTSLDLSNNELTGSIPGEIRFLTNLITLDLSNNLMTGVPAEIGSLSNLKNLNLSNNRLTGLPNELANLKNLEVLDISGNDYSQQDLDVIEKGLPSTVEIIK